jgi:N-acetylmuramoyl-L-alanine amidase
MMIKNILLVSTVLTVMTFPASAYLSQPPMKIAITDYSPQRPFDTTLLNMTEETPQAILIEETLQQVIIEETLKEVISQDDEVVTLTQAQKDCLAQNVYHEARSESVLGMRAVAWVTLNRVDSEAYPDSPCAVVRQAKKDTQGNPIRNKCQFSWFCDGKKDVIADKEAWRLSTVVADMVALNHARSRPVDPTDGAIMYHATYVDPYWSSAYERTTRIDQHVFYK